MALPDGRVRVLFKAPWRSGATHADMPPDRFLARLIGAALDDLDMHPALHACVQLALAGPHEHWPNFQA